jgi:lambda family phage portal protein
MGLLSALGLSRKRTGEAKPRLVRARYDAALGAGGERHWANADALSADAAMDPRVRETLRNRSRYEVANNSYAAGIVRTLADDTVGTGPRLQIQAGDRDASAIVENAWHRWSSFVDLPGKLRTMRMSRARDGEVFAVLTSNPRVGQATGVSLDVQLIEADQVYAPFGGDIQPSDDQQNIDGVVIDRDGNPIAYTIAEVHPGARDGLRSGLGRFRRLSRDVVLHYFRGERPGQHRGVPELTPALPLFAQLRRYTLAVLGAAETAASFAGILYTDAPAGGEAEAIEPLDPINLERQALLTMPGGWRMEQLRAEQPSTGYGDFKHEILNEIARCLSMPFNVAAGNSSGYNYASGRLDHQTYHKAIGVERDVLGRTILDPILAAWRSEAVLLEDVIPPRLRSTPWGHSWMWPGHPHVDPNKEATAASIRLEAGLTTLADEYASQGKDWEQQLRQRAREMELAAELGLEMLGAAVADAEDDEDDEDDIA